MCVCVCGGGGVQIRLDPHCEVLITNPLKVYNCINVQNMKPVQYLFI